MKQDLTLYAEDEDGGGTIFSLFLFVTLAIILGVMVDATNAWRNSTMLASAADMGSHAGAVALANSAGETAAIDAARAQVQRNMPTARFGDTVGQAEDIYLLHFDPDTRRLSNSGPKNAVAVRANQLGERSNAVGTFLLSFAGLMSWDVNAVSVAAFDVSAECKGTDGIYGEARIRASSQNHFGNGYCVHSNDHVWLPQQNTFEAGSLVSMPDIADCGSKCTDTANPGIRATEINMIFPDFGDFIDATYDDFAASGLAAGTRKETFYSDRSLGDLAPLREAGVLGEYDQAWLGDVVELSHAEFHSLETLPSGLVYTVSCPSNGNSAGTKLTFDGSTARMRDAAVLTNCSLDFEDGSQVAGSLIVTTRASSSATVTAGQNVTIGDSVAGSCAPEDRTTIMSASGVNVPAKFAASNVTLIADDTVDIASSSSLGETSYGLTIYATGEIDIASQHTFISCGAVDDNLVPRGKLIRHVATN